MKQPFRSDTVGVLLTGSRVYGTPTKESDIDLVVLMSWDAAAALREQADEVGEYEGADLCLRFGKLNLLVTSQVQMYNAWVRGTAQLFARRPVTRDEARAVMEQERNRGYAFPPSLPEL